jgi:hypothetical protein
MGGRAGKTQKGAEGRVQRGTKRKDWKRKGIMNA